MQQEYRTKLEDISIDLKSIVNRLSRSIADTTEDITVKAVVGIYGEAIIIAANRIKTVLEQESLLNESLLKESLLKESGVK